MLAARFLTTLNHEMGISASARPFPFNAFGMSTSANDGVSTAVGRRIFNSPNMRTGAMDATMHCTTRTLAHFPCVKLFATHETRAFARANQNSVRQDVKNRHAKGVSSSACNVKMFRRHGIQGNQAPSRAWRPVFKSVSYLSSGSTGNPDEILQ
jgi:hypothetical protein